MAYRVVVLASAEADLERLDAEIRRRVELLKVYRVQHRSEVYRRFE